MNIYIYGSQSFKKDIHSTLEHANIKFKLDSDTLIKDVESLDELKNVIKENPNNIYLIDDEKIIKKNSKIKFLNPKDGIEEEFLLDNGIADLSVDTLNEIPKYILKRYEELKGVSQEIQNSIIDIVDDAYEKSDTNKEEIVLDDELSMLLSKEDDKLDDIDNSFDISLDDLSLTDSIEGFEDDFGLNNSSFDYDDSNLLGEKQSSEIKSEEVDNLDDLMNDLDLGDLLQSDVKDNMDKIEDNKEINFSKGEKMSGDFSELDLINEKDLLDAIGNLDTNLSSKPISSNVQANNIKQNSENISLDSFNVNQLSELINKLLQNKTLEITIKIKD